MDFETFRLKFGEIVKENTEGVDYLNPTRFKDIKDKMAGRGLKFYQYRVPTVRSIGQLRNGELWCSDPKTFNDVFEGMVQSKDDDAIDVKSVIDKASDSVRIACFSETHPNQLMYAHYTDSFTGFCIEYDYDRMLNCIKDITYFFPVIYQNEPSGLAKMRALKNTIDNYQSGKSSDVILDDLISYFIHKANIWEYEREWRLIVPISKFRDFFTLEAERGKYRGIENFDCVSAIYFAANIDGYAKELIKDIIREKNSRKKKPSERIKLYETHIQESSYELECDEVNL